MRWNKAEARRTHSKIKRKRKYFLPGLKTCNNYNGAAVSSVREHMLEKKMKCACIRIAQDINFFYWDVIYWFWKSVLEIGKQASFIFLWRIELIESGNFFHQCDECKLKGLKILVIEIQSPRYFDVPFYLEVGFFQSKNCILNQFENCIIGKNQNQINVLAYTLYNFYGILECISCEKCNTLLLHLFAFYEFLAA